MSVILPATMLLLTLTMVLQSPLIIVATANESIRSLVYQTDELEQSNSSCPPWKYDKYHNSSCACGVGLQGVVRCSDAQSSVFLLSCNCMSYSNQDNSMLVVGNCMYLCSDRYETRVSEHTDLNDLCNLYVQQNRRGQMCGNCNDNHSPSPYSYLQRCVHCSNYRYNWIKYVLIAFLPLTIFYLLVIMFKFNAVLSPAMTGFIFFCQIISSPAFMSIISSYTYSWDAEGGSSLNLKLVLGQQIISTVYGIWNLDFFRMVYEPFCLHPNLSMLQILSLDYLVAVYPLCLVCLTYLLVQLHDRFQIVKYLWKPMAWLCGRFNRQWKVSNSLIEAFGAFFLLSYVKITNTSFNLLIPTRLHNASGHVVGLYSYYNGSLEYFGRDHLPYAVLAIFMFTIFNLMPLLLLCLYPCRCFQSCLNCCQLNSQVLRTFMDAFQGCYKFEPYDCRYWAAFYLFLRILILAFFGLTRNMFFPIITGITLIPVIVLIMVIRPYRETIYNAIDVIFFLAIVQIFFSFSAMSLADFINRRFKMFAGVPFGVALLFPLVYALLLAFRMFLPNKWIASVRICIFHTFCKRNEPLQVREDEDTDDDLLQHLANVKWSSSTVLL